MIKYLIQGFLILSVTFGQSNILSISDQTLVGGDTAWVEINISNTDDIAGLQFDLSYPSELVYIDSNRIGDRFEDHDLQIQLIDSYLRVIAYSPSLTPLSGNSGLVLTLGFSTAPVLGDFTISFTNPVLANTSYENVLTESVNATLILDTPAPQLSSFSPIEIMEDGSFTIEYDTLLAHVTDVDTPLENIIFTLESDSLIITAQGEDYLVTSPIDWDGRDTILITASDGFYYDQEFLPVYVINVNDAPIFSDIQDVEFPEDSIYTLAVQDIVSDVDDEISELNWFFESSSENLLVSLESENMVIQFLPEQDFYNTGISVFFTVQDTSGATDTASAIVNITAVNDPPVFFGTLPNILFLEDSFYSVPVSDWYSLVGDVDDADNTLDWAFDEDINISVSQDNGVVTFTSDPDWYGNETLTVIVSDGLLSDSTDLLISVASVNDAPASFDLLSPDDEYLLTVSDITFYWNSTTDVDDTDLETSFHLVADDLETVQIVDGQDYSLNVFNWGLPYGDPIQWWIEVSDGDTSTVSETRIFTVSTDLNHTGPSWFVDVDGSDTNGNGSSTYPFSTIQHAHDVSAENDSIQIQVGTYYEHITIDHSLTIVGVTVFGEKPILDGSGSGRIITTGDNATLSVRDLTFSDGYYNDQGGAAIYSFYEPLHVINCEFIGNTVDGGGRGGAIETHSENSLIKNCYFENNQSLSSSGGAVGLWGGLVDSCTFVSNTADGNGGAINIEDNATVRRSLFTDNTAGSNGGAIYITVTAADVINNTVYNNQANYGGGISTYNSASKIINTILWQNTAYSSGGQVYNSGSPSPEYSYCDIQGGFSGNQNINENPVFLDSELGLFGLIEGSPCIDRGDPDLDNDDVEWFEDFDDQDVDGTRMDIGAFTYLGPDTIPPTITILAPLGGETYGTGERVSFQWDAADDRVINWTKIYISYDAGVSYSLLDSLSGNPGGLSVDLSTLILTNQGKVKVEVSDWGANIVEDMSTGLFNIVDIISPEITLLLPGSNFSTYEYAQVVAVWESSDNIDVDSVLVLYSNDGSLFSLIDAVPSENLQHEFSIPSGVTDNAQIKLVAKDEAGNTDEVLSDFFSVTDNTPPTINLSAPEDVAIGQSLNINWTASDNTVLRSNHLYYSQQPGYEFVFIDSVAGNETNYSWVAPNFVSNQVRVIVETFDNVNLSTADTSSFFLIFDNTPPEINILTPVDGFIVPEFEPLSVTWLATDNIEMDSVRIYFSNDNGNNFIFIGEVPHSTTEYEFLTPSGITNSAQLRLDAIDIYGNEGQIFSDLFSVSDNTPPDVTIENFPSLHIEEEAIIYWSSNDNTGIDFHRLFLSTDNGDSYSQIDSVSGGDSSLSWIVPNIATENALLSIVSTDLVGLSDSDTTLVFSILDGINPQVTVSEFEENYSIPEFQPITIEWNASDNILLDSAKVWYSPNNGEEFVYVGIGLATSSSFTFDIPQGMTDQAMIKVEVFDTAQNTAIDTSTRFFVTDYTPPSINIVGPISNERFNIDGIMDINWSASDNVMVSRIDIYYSTDLGQNWESIFSDLSNTGVSTWTVVNDPSDVVQLRIIAFDDVGLSDTSVVEDLAIDIVYPQVLDLFPTPGPISWLDQSITISFNQMMLPEGFNEDFIRFESMHSDSISGSFSYIDSIQSLRIDLSNGFSGMDTVTIILDADGVSNYYGYPLDGNGDDIGGDDYSFEYQIGMIADYNADQVINGSDLSIFISSWNDNDYLNELGPYSGVVPNIVVDPDDNFNIEDVMSFVVLGNWYLSNFGLAVSNQESPSIDMSYEVNEKSIKVLLPEEAMVYDLQVSYDINSFKSDFKQSEEQISLVQNNNELGILNVISQIKQNKTVIIPFEIQNKNTSIQLYVQTYDENGKVLSNTLEVLDIHAIPDEFVLTQNYPNPFNPVTHIEYGLPLAGHVDLVIYDILGREVLTLFNEMQEAGYKTISWNGTNQGGLTVGAGMYFYVLKMNHTTKIKKMLFLK
ncbi:T9SS type A sorting domain-containing protein [Candidatus Marinimicrobia bacterium]|nr:T9SS type A sorting domain-containing protein [Candidatus Neomarinimicrobiota bacterium]